MSYSAKAILLVVNLIGLGFNSVAQDGIGIGTEDVNVDAILEIDSSTDGLLIPRMNTSERNAIGASSEGLIVYDTDHSAFLYYDGQRWLRLVVQPAQVDLNLNHHKIVNLADGTSFGDAVNRGQLDRKLDRKLDLAGGTMEGDIVMSNYRIAGLANGTDNLDAVNIGQLMALESSIGRLHQGDCTIGDVSGDTRITCHFGIDLGTSNYLVLGSLRVNSSDAHWAYKNNDATWVIVNETATGFQIDLEEGHSDHQSLIFRYIIFSM